MNIKITLENLVNKFEEMKPYLDDVCYISSTHGMPYRGPSWDEELKEAKVALEKINNKSLNQTTESSKNIDLFNTNQLDFNFERPIKDETEL